MPLVPVRRQHGGNLTPIPRRQANRRVSGPQAAQRHRGSTASGIVLSRVSGP